LSNPISRLNWSPLTSLICASNTHTYTYIFLLVYTVAKKGIAGVIRSDDSVDTD